MISLEDLAKVPYIVKKDIKTYYFKPPNISWGILFPAALVLAFSIRNPSDIREMVPGLVGMAVLFGTTCEIEFGPWKVPHKVIALPKTERQITNGIDTSKTYSCMVDIPLDFAMTQITELLNETR